MAASPRAGNDLALCQPPAPPAWRINQHITQRAAAVGFRWCGDGGQRIFPCEKPGRASIIEAFGGRRKEKQILRPGAPRLRMTSMDCVVA